MSRSELVASKLFIFQLAIVIRTAEEKNLGFGLTPPFKYLFIEIDWALSRIVAWLLSFLITTSLIVGSLYLIKQGVLNISEYGEGLAEISNFEFCFILCAALLIYRLMLYSAQTTVSGWIILITPLVWFGKLLLIGWILVSFIILTNTGNGTSYKEFVLFTQQFEFQLIVFTLALVSLYISVPSKKLHINVQNNEVPETDSSSDIETQQSNEQKETVKEETNENIKTRND